MVNDSDKADLPAEIGVEPGAGPAAAASGKPSEPSAPSGAEPTQASVAATPGLGAQVVLTGDAQAAARGGTHNDIMANTLARDAAIVAGHIQPATASAAVGATQSSVGLGPDAAEEAAVAEFRVAYRAAMASEASKASK